MAYEISKCVICLHETPQHQRLSPPLPQEPKNPQVFFFCFFFTRAALPVFHLSIAQKAKASNDTRY